MRTLWFLIPLNEIFCHNSNIITGKWPENHGNIIFSYFILIILTSCMFRFAHFSTRSLNYNWYWWYNFWGRVTDFIRVVEFFFVHNGKNHLHKYIAILNVFLISRTVPHEIGVCYFFIHRFLIFKRVWAKLYNIPKTISGVWRLHLAHILLILIVKRTATNLVPSREKSA